MISQFLDVESSGGRRLWGGLAGVGGCYIAVIPQDPNKPTPPEPSRVSTCWRRPEKVAHCRVEGPQNNTARDDGRPQWALCGVESGNWCRQGWYEAHFSPMRCISRGMVLSEIQSRAGEGHELDAKENERTDGVTESKYMKKLGRSCLYSPDLSTRRNNHRRNCIKAIFIS